MQISALAHASWTEHSFFLSLCLSRIHREDFIAAILMNHLSSVGWQVVKLKHSLASYTQPDFKHE